MEKNLRLHLFQGEDFQCLVLDTMPEDWMTMETLQTMLKLSRSYAIEAIFTLLYKSEVVYHSFGNKKESKLILQ